jgi:tRNA threonylcarbamoyladenosine biosynthesis protein TsaB
LLSGDRVLAQAHEPMAKGQAERLMPLIEEVLAEGGQPLGASTPSLSASVPAISPVFASPFRRRGPRPALNVPAIGSRASR